MIRKLLVFACVPAICGCAMYPEATKVNTTGVADVLDDANQRREAMELSERLTAQGDALIEQSLERAIEKYRGAIRAWPRAPIAYNNLGYALLKRGQIGDIRDANDALLIAAEQMPTDARPLQNLGVLMMRVGRNKDAYDLFIEALDRDPNDLGSLRGIVQAAHMLQRANDDVLRYVERAQLYLANTPDWGPYLARRHVEIKQQLEHEY